MRKKLLLLSLSGIIFAVLLFISCFTSPVNPDFYLSNPDNIEGGVPPAAPSNIYYLGRVLAPIYTTNTEVSSGVTNYAYLTNTAYNFRMQWSDMHSGYNYTNWYYIVLPG